MQAFVRAFVQGISQYRHRVAPLGLFASLLTACGLMAAASQALAAPAFAPSERVLPTTTRLWVSLREPDAVRESFNRTPYGQMLKDPVMQAFVASFRDQIRNAGRQRLKKLGLTLEDLEKIPSGELAIACLEPTPDVAAIVLVVDATGNEKDLAALLDQIIDRLGKQGGRRLSAPVSTVATDGLEVTVFELPPDPADRTSTTEYAAFASTGSALVIGDHVAAVKETFTSLAKGRPDSLESLPAFKPVMERTAKGLPSDRSPVRWYVDPLGYAGLMETLRERRESSLPKSATASKNGGVRSDHRTAILRRNGFDCIKGAGGHVVFDAGGREILHQSLVYAPPVPGRDPFGPERFNSSGRMLRFPNAGAIEPAAWVPRDVGAWTAFDWDMKTAFQTVEPLFDDMAGDKGVFDELMESLRDDADGPHIDFEKEMVGALGTRVVVLSDHVQPIDAEADRLLIAIEAKDEKVLAATIEKCMQAEPDMRRVEHGGHAVWEFVEKEVTIPKLQIETSAGKVDHEDSAADHDHAHRLRERRREREQRLLPHSAVTVAKGHLLIGSHIDFVQKVLDMNGGPESLASSGDYQSVTTETARLFPSKMALRSFGRAEKTVRPTYEAIRSGTMPSSKSLLAQFLNDMLSEGKPGSVRRQRIDGSTLPDFEAVRKYFGTSGIGVETEEQGWFVTGFAFAPGGGPESEVAGRPTAPASR